MTVPVRSAAYARRLEWVVLVSAIAVLLAVRLPFLPPTLDDIDSVNFDLGVHDFDPIHHQPHPPGYPVYIFLARLCHSWFSSHAAGLAVLSALFSALSVVPLYLLMARLTSRKEAALVCALTLFNPLVWFNSVRPMSDLTGFFLVTAAQYALMAALADEATVLSVSWLIGTALAGISIGVRLQAVWLVGPTLLYGMWRLRSRRAFVATAGIFSAAVAVWLVPLVILSGGARPLLDAFTSMVQTSMPSESLAVAFTVRRALIAAGDVFLAPWRAGLGTVVLLAACGGVAIVARSDRRLLGRLLLLFLPYALYHYALQSTPNLRYAVPIVPLVACLASVAVIRGARRFSLLPLLGGAAAVLAAGASTLPALEAYHSTSSPPFQALAAFERLNLAPGSVTVTGHKIFERYLARVPRQDVLMPVEGAQSTLEAYWRDGGRKPVLFFKQPVRTTLLLFGLDRRETVGRWEWPATVKPFMQGERPGRVELLRLEPPRWFAESGLLISDEAGPIERILKQRPRLRVRPSARRRALAISGFLHGSRSANLSLELGDQRQATWKVGEWFVVHTMLDPVPASAGYIPVSLDINVPAVVTDVWLEPFSSLFVRPAQGFFTAERDAATELFRWIAPAATATVYLPVSRGRLAIDGWVPETYYRLPVALALAWNGHPLAPYEIRTARFHVERDLAGSPSAPWGELRINSSQSFVPDERQDNGDRRRVAVKIYQMALTSIP